MICSLSLLSLFWTPQHALDAPPPGLAFVANEGLAAHTGFTVTNHGVAVSRLLSEDPIVAGGRVVGVLVEEADQDQRLNFDDDKSDQVLFVYDGSNETFVNLSLAVPDNQVFAGNDTILFVSEEAQVATDWNADGDALDTVFFLRQPGDNAVNLGIAADTSFLNYETQGPSRPHSPSPGDVRGNTLTLVASESDQGETDWNGDGDTDDAVLLSGPFQSASGLQSLGGTALPKLSWLRRRAPVNAITLSYLSMDGFTGKLLDEFEAGADFNGDGDMQDLVAGVIRKPNGRQKNLGLAVDFLFGAQDLLVPRAWERANGEIDLNGDGDTNDLVPHVVDLASGAVTNLGLDGILSSITSSHVVIRASESGNQQDLNGDGDFNDRVAHVWERAGGSLTSLGLASRNAAQVGSFLALSVSEVGETVDLNGDGDALDDVMFVVDLEAGAVRNLGLAIPTNTFTWLTDMRSDRVLFFSVSELRQGVDLNGNGALTEFVFFAYDPVDDVLWNSGHAIRQFAPGALGAVSAFLVPESGQGADLNGDGDQLDEVLHVFDAATWTLTNVGLAARRTPLLFKNHVAFAVHEFDQGGVDLNGTGAPESSVFHTLRLP